MVGISATRMTLSYLFLDIEQADKFSKICLPELWTVPPSAETICVMMYGGMTAVAMASKGKHYWRNVRKAREALRLIKKYANICPENFLDKQYLLEAEIFALRGNLRATEKFISAIAVAKHFGFLHCQALANERMARYLVSKGKFSLAEPYFHEACGLYGKWKAHAKVRHLQNEIDQLYSER